VFNIGVLQALYDKKLLRNIDVISAVSGGSYTLSWLVFQLYYSYKFENRKSEITLADLFDSKSHFQRYLLANAALVDAVEATTWGVMTATFGQLIRSMFFMIGDENFVNNGNMIGSAYRKKALSGSRCPSSSTAL
jgi:hypothetical protein